MADDLDLFGGMTKEEEEAAAARKEKAKAAPVGKSQIVYEVKPWDDTTNLDEMEKAIREISMDGLEWLGSERKDVAFGIKKLMIVCNVTDDVCTEDLEQAITDLEDYVQSVDIYSFNKL